MRGLKAPLFHMEAKMETGQPDFSKAYSPRRQFKLTRAMYYKLEKRIEALEKLVGSEEAEPDKPKRKRRTKEELEAESAKTK
jgi:hypothetical protein